MQEESERKATGSVDGGASAAATALEYGKSENIFVFMAIPAASILFGLALPIMARWALGSFGALPVKPVIRLVGHIEGVWQTAFNVLVWLVFGLGIAFVAKRESARATVSDQSVDVAFQGTSTSFPRDTIMAIFPCGKHTVFLDRESRILFDEPMEAPLVGQREAFRRHQYPWLDEDPFADRYEPWRPAP